MNNVFNLRRFTQLFVNHTVANYRNYLMSFGVLMGILFLVMVSMASGKNFRLSDSARQIYFSIFLFIGGAIFTTGIFSNLGDKRKAIAYLMLPASNFEKLLVAWLYSFVIFHLLYLAGFYIIDMVILSLGHREVNHSAIMKFGSDFKYSAVLLAFAWLHSIAFFGALSFKKLHFIKTAFTVFVLILVITLLNRVSIHLMIGSFAEANEPFSELTIYEGKKSFYLKQSDLVLLLPYLGGCMSLLLWVGAYFKLKETEV